MYRKSQQIKHTYMMAVFHFILFLYITLVHNQSVKSNGDLTSCIPRLEHIVSDLRAEIKVKEQADAKVLTEILSKLALTTDELTKVQTREKYQAAVLSSILSKLLALEKEHNSTLLELEELKNWKVDAERLLQSSRNNYTSVINQLTGMLNQTELSSAGTHKWWHKEIGFQASLSTNTLDTVEGDVLKFDIIQYNAGDGYNSTSGIYVAPASGSYLFWCYIFNYAHQSLYVCPYHNKVRKDCAYADVYAGVASLTHIMHLDDGDSVWFSTIHASRIHGQGYSNFGGTLLHGT